MTLLMSAIAAGLLLAGGSVLADNRLGSSSVARGCDVGLAAGLGLLVIAGVFMMLARTVADMRTWHESWRDWPRLVVACPAPAAVLALTAPASVGCRTGSSLGHTPVVGGALAGDPAIAVAAAAAALLGASLASVVRVRTVDHLLALQLSGGQDSVTTANAAETLEGPW